MTTKRKSEFFLPNHFLFLIIYVLKEMLSRQLKVLKRSTLKFFFFGHLNENSVRIKNSFKEHFTYS